MAVFFSFFVIRNWLTIERAEYTILIYVSLGKCVFVDMH